MICEYCSKHKHSCSSCQMDYDWEWHYCSQECFNKKRTQVMNMLCAKHNLTTEAILDIMDELSDKYIIRQQ